MSVLLINKKVKRLMAVVEEHDGDVVSLSNYILSTRKVDIIFDNLLNATNRTIKKRLRFVINLLSGLHMGSIFVFSS